MWYGRGTYAYAYPYAYSDTCSNRTSRAYAYSDTCGRTRTSRAHIHTDTNCYAHAKRIKRPWCIRVGSGCTRNEDARGDGRRVEV